MWTLTVISKIGIIAGEEKERGGRNGELKAATQHNLTEYDIGLTQTTHRATIRIKQPTNLKEDICQQETQEAEACHDLKRDADF